ncbi:MAG TPA: hypothetical protein VJQ54_09965 [Candidatus Sulfotelmatobacter sp.]|nr:hypothetical protein [Candidatus Sulfotelmatobacter sp.]
MPTFYTKAEARAFAKNTLNKAFAADSGRILRESVTAATNSDRFDIFLSHASKDAELILGVKGLLQNQGFSVYVDWVDDSQLDRTKVSHKTAELLRRRMRQSLSLLWVATEAASDSKWMPWELGYFDGFRPQMVAVLPLVDNPQQTFKGQEYLALYPVVDKDNYTHGSADVFVEDSAGQRWSTLKNFGKGNPVWTAY